MSNYNDYEDYDDELCGDYSLDYGYAEDLDEDGNELENLNEDYDEEDLCSDYNDF